MAATEEAISYVRDVLTNDTAGPPLGPGEIGIDVPDIVSAGAPLTITVTGADATGTSCRVVRRLHPPAGRLCRRCSVTTGC